MQSYPDVSSVFSWLPQFWCKLQATFCPFLSLGKVLGLFYCRGMVHTVLGFLHFGERKCVIFEHPGFSSKEKLDHLWNKTKLLGWNSFLPQLFHICWWEGTAAVQQGTTSSPQHITGNLKPDKQGKYSGSGTLEAFLMKTEIQKSQMVHFFKLQCWLFCSLTFPGSLCGDIFFTNYQTKHFLLYFSLLLLSFEVLFHG